MERQRLIDEERLRNSHRAQANVVLSLVLSAVVAGCGGAPRAACDPDPLPGTLGSICGFANPEDVEVVQSAKLLLVSQMRHAGRGGSIAAMSLDRPAQQPRVIWPAAGVIPDSAAKVPVGDPSCTNPPSPDGFAPHGIAAVATGDSGVVRIAAVGHGDREAIELFDLSGAADAATLAWRGCIPLPPDTVANDVRFAPGGEIVASNYMPCMSGALGFYYMLASGMGRNTGDIMTWRAEQGWQHIAGTTAPAPNGVALSPDGKNIFYAETGSGLVRRKGHGNIGARDKVVAIGGNPDNLSTSETGTILAVTHTDGAGFLLCAFGWQPCRTGWSLFAIDPNDLTATQLLHHDGSTVGAVASAAQFEDWIYFGAVFDDRIGVWKPARTARSGK